MHRMFKLFLFYSIFGQGSLSELCTASQYRARSHNLLIKPLWHLIMALLVCKTLIAWLASEKADETMKGPSGYCHVCRVKSS